MEPLPSGLVQHRRPAEYPFGPRSLAAILEHGLAEHPDRLALIDGERSWTWRELDVAVAASASMFHPGERAVMLFGNSAETIIAALGLWRVGGIAAFSPGNRTVWLGQGRDDLVGPTTLLEDTAQLQGDPPSCPDDEIDPFAPAAIAFTSGTSGRPKAVVHNQRGLLCPGLVSISTEPPKNGERIGTPLNLQILNVMVLGPISSLLRGSTFVVMSSPKSRRTAEEVERFGVSRMFAVPTLLHDLVEHIDDPMALRSLDRVIVGGSGADPALLRRFEGRFGIRPTLSYGMTETPTGVVRESLDDPIGSGRGFALPHVNISVRDPAGEVVPTGTTGEIYVGPADSGPWADSWRPTLGYLGDPERTAALFMDGALRTGDLGTLDADGALSVHGRLSDTIIRGGTNVDPAEVAAVLEGDPAVAEAVVCGYPDERLGQRVGAVVVPAGDQSINRDRLRDAVTNQISADATPDAIVVGRSLPRSAMGKVSYIDPAIFEEGDHDIPSGRARSDRGHSGPIEPD